MLASRTEPVLSSDFINKVTNIRSQLTRVYENSKRHCAHAYGRAYRAQSTPGTVHHELCYPRAHDRRDRVDQSPSRCPQAAHLAQIARMPKTQSSVSQLTGEKAAPSLFCTCPSPLMPGEWRGLHPSQSQPVRNSSVPRCPGGLGLL